MREPPQDPVRPFFEEQRLDDDRPEARHPRGKPFGNPAAVEWKIG